MHPANSKGFRSCVRKLGQRQNKLLQVLLLLKKLQIISARNLGQINIYIFFHYFTLPICPFFSGRSTCSQIFHNLGILKLILKDIKARTFWSPVSSFNNSQLSISSFPSMSIHKSPRDFPIFPLKPLCCLFNCWTPKGVNCITITKKQ